MEKKLRFGEIKKKISDDENKNSCSQPELSAVSIDTAADSIQPHSDNAKKHRQGSNKKHSEDKKRPPLQSVSVIANIKSSTVDSQGQSNLQNNKNPVNQSASAINPQVSPFSTNAQSESFDTISQGYAKKTEDDEENFDIYKYINIIFRRKKIVLTILLVITLLSIFRYLTAAHYYSSTARLLFTPNAQQIVNDAQFSQTNTNYEKAFLTHLELLKSNNVLTLVSQNLNNRISPDKIRRGLTIKRGETNGQKNEIIELSYINQNADLSKDVLNELCRTYIEYRKDINAQELSKLIFKFEVQIDKIQKELSSKENNLRLFKEDNRMVQLSSETNLTVSKISDMELALQQTNLSLVETSQRINSITSQITKQEQDIVQSFTLSDPFQKKIADLELELNSLSSEYSPEHYKVRMLKQQIDNLKTAAIDSIQNEAYSKTFIKNPIRQTLLQDLINLSVQKSALEQKAGALEKIIKILNSDLLKLPSLEQKYAFLERETESILQTLRMLKTKYEETKIKRDSQESDLKLLEMAETPLKAYSKINFSKTLISIIIGLIISIALALLLEYLDQSLKDPRDVERELELPLLGVVPQIENNTILFNQNSDLVKSILEPFRALRANLKHIATQNNIKTFIICSAIKGEGKTTLSANLAATFSLDNKKVILIDADLRRSQLHSLFNIDKKNGLADYLLCKSSLDEIIKPTIYPNLSIITSGERPDNPAELLGTYRFDTLLTEIRDKADYIIFDSPALLPVSDSITMAPKMDCCLMVVRTLWTPVNAAAEAKNQLKRVGTRIFGGILNGIVSSRGYYPYYYGYYGYSSYKYSYDDDRSPKFSLRQFGLDVESQFRETIGNITFAIPRYVANLKSGISYLFRRKFFWFLLSVFILLAGLLVFLDYHKKPSDYSDIQYIGISGGLGSREKNNFAINDMAIPADNNKSFDKTGNSVFIKADSASILKNGLSDSVEQWVNAMSEKNFDKYISFYDSGAFKSADASFNEWKQKTASDFNSAGKEKLSISKIESGKKGVSFIEIIITTINNSGTKNIYNLVWQISTDGWKIVEEKSRRQEN